MNCLMIDEVLRQRNLAAYEARYRVRPTVDPQENEKYAVTQAADGKPVLCIRMTDGYNDQWVPMNSMESPVDEVTEWAGRIHIANKRTTVAMLGFGMGYQLAALMKCLRPDTTFVIYEPQEGMFSFICGFIDLTELFRLDSKVSLILPSCSSVFFYYCLQNDVLQHFSQALPIRLPYYAKNDVFETAWVQVSDAIETNVAYRQLYGRKSLTNRMYAWMDLWKSTVLDDWLDRVPKEMPVVIVAAGPSLVKNVELLQELKGRAMIVCVDRAFHILEEHSVVPDLLVTVDADKAPDYLLSSENDDLPLLCAFQANVETQKRYQGDKIYCHALLLEKMIPGIGKRIRVQAELGGNVAGAALITFLVHGTHDIILVGQDLAMSGRESHADGSNVGLSIGSGIVFIEGIDGKPVASRGDWLMFLRVYEQYLKLFPGPRVIDATEGGARIHGTDVMTLRQVLDEVCLRSWDVASCLHDLPKAHTEDEHIEMIGAMEHWREELTQIEADSQELVTLCEKLVMVCRHHDISDKKNLNMMERIDTLRGRICESEVNEMLERMWVEDPGSIPDRTFVVRNNEEALPVFEQAAQYFRHLPEDCRSLSQAIEEVLTAQEV